MALNLITDRTQADVERIRALLQKPWSEFSQEERDEWLYNRLKGAYNYTDLNRVEEAVETLTKALGDLGFPLALTIKTNWNLWDIPTGPVMIRYLQNLQRLRSAVNVFATITPELPTTMEHLTFESANRIEEVLERIDGWVTGMEKNRRYTGEVFCGE